ncbi:MAG: hypothetical protein EB103_05625, partial [Actinobacteria bacterium]|nr:hypothetical protein [Actinomycetota bacterium]
MKQSKLISIFSSMLMTVGIITFTPSIKPAVAADGEKDCTTTTCTVTYSFDGSVQTFSPSAVGQVLTISVNGGAGGKGGNDAGGPGGAGSNGASFSFNYTTTSTNPLYLYVGAAGEGASGCVTGWGGALGGASSWTGQYAGGKGGNAGSTGCSGAGGGGGAASVVALEDKAQVLAVAAGGAGGTGANISSNGAAGAIAGATVAGTNGGNGANFNGDGGGGGAGGGGVAGGAGSSGGGDGSGGGSSARAGTSLVPTGGTLTYTSKASGFIAITYQRGPDASVKPSFSDSTKAFVGQTWTPAIGTWTSVTNAVPTISKKVWQVSTDGVTFTDVSPAVTGNYTTSATDVGKYFRYAVTASDSNGTTLEYSVVSPQVTAAPVFTAENPTGASVNTTADTAFSSYTFVATGY